MKRKNNKNDKLFGISRKDLNKAGRQIGIVGTEFFIGSLKVAGKVLPANDAKLSGENHKSSPSVQRTKRDLQKELEKLNKLKRKKSKTKEKPRGRK